MRELMVSDVYFPRVNGVSTSIETFRRTLAAFGVEVRLVVPGYGEDAAEDGVTRVRGWPVPGDREDRLVGWRAMHAAVLDAARDCDLIHVQTPFVAHYAGLAAARKLGRPVLATYHTLFEEYLQHYAPFLPAGWLRRQARGWSRRQCNALDAVVVPSTAMRERLAGYGVEAPMHVLPTGIPLAALGGGDRARFRMEHDIAADQPVALFVGRVAHEKNIGFLLDALRHALRARPDLLLLIAGEGPALEELRGRVRRDGLEAAVRFVGYLDRARALPSCYAAADVFVFASRTETQGLVLLEAMAAGVPVLALAEMGTIDILQPGRGSVSPPADPLVFGAELASLVADEARLRALGAEARKYVQQWSDTAMAQRMAKLYAGLLQRASAVRRAELQGDVAVAAAAEPARGHAGTARESQ